MLSLALAAALVVSAEPPAGAPRWAEPPETVSHLSAFLVGVSLHGKDAARVGLGEDAIRSQIEETLRARHIAVASAIPESPHEVGFVILDVHVAQAGASTSVAWTLHASQLVQLHSGAAALASTWEVGDLIQGPSDRIAGRVRSSLQPALDELCDAYLAARPPPQPEPQPQERLGPPAADL